MSLNALSNEAISNIELYFPNMSIYFTPGDSVYSVHSDPEYLSYKVVKLYEPRYHNSVNSVKSKSVKSETSQWEFYGSLERDSDGSVGDYLLYVMNDKMEYSLNFISDDMGMTANANDDGLEKEEQEEEEYYEYGNIEIAKEFYRSSMF
jgi:hypothetical protein